MDQLLTKLEKQKIEWETDCPLSQHSTFRIGGRARLALFPDTREKLVGVLRMLQDAGFPVLVVGRGSNVVFSDCGYDGAVVLTDKCRAVRVCGERIYADAGVLLSKLANEAREASLSGLEFAHGIPGTLGGAIYMNAGAYGGSMDAVCVATECYDLDSGRICTFRGAQQAFGYRTSVFARGGHYVILGAELSLKVGDPSRISAQMRDYWERRKASQPLEFPSAGSVFKRPEGHFAGKLIEDCGLKGLTVGGAQVSEKHAGFIINRGSATCEDVKRLVEQIQAVVLERTGVALECEIRFL